MRRLAQLLAVAGCVFASCPSNSKRSAHRSVCFTFFNNPMSFFQAELFCEKLGGHLASVTDAQEVQGMTTLVSGKTDKQMFWIGATHPSAYDSVTGYKWRDRTPFNYTRWSQGEPNTANRCVSSSVSTGDWTTTACSTPLPVMCITNEHVSLNGQQAAPRQFCPTGSHYFPDTQFCYTVLTTRLTFHEAEAECVLLGGHLASIHSSNENAFANRIARTGYPFGHLSSVWIGLRRDSQQRSVFVWTDGSFVDYSNWNPNQPDDWDGKEGCVQTFPDSGYDWMHTYHWNDEQCSLKMRAAVCKVPATESS